MSLRIPPGWGYAEMPRAPSPRAAQRRSPGNPAKVSQCARIAYWLGTLRYVPDASEIQARWHVSRATAYRYHRFAENAGELPLYPLNPKGDHR